MKIRPLLMTGIISATLAPALVLAQQANGPAPAAAPRTFAQWDKIEITVETEADPDDESTYRGSYALSFFEPGTAGADDRRIEVSGPISCGAD